MTAVFFKVTTRKCEFYTYPRELSTEISLTLTLKIISAWERGVSGLGGICKIRIFLHFEKFNGSQIHWFLT